MEKRFKKTKIIILLNTIFFVLALIFSFTKFKVIYNIFLFGMFAIALYVMWDCIKNQESDFKDKQELLDSVKIEVKKSG